MFLILKLLMLLGRSIVILTRGLPKVSPCIRILTIGTIKLLLKNLENPWVFALLGLMHVVFELVVLFLTSSRRREDDTLEDALSATIHLSSSLITPGRRGLAVTTTTKKKKKTRTSRSTRLVQA